MVPYRLSDCRFEWIDRLSRVDHEAWDALARPLATPLFDFDWLDLLERSGSVSVHTGWQPCHLIVRAGGTLVAAAPLYIKSHSEGEFVFDGIWAELAQSAGIRYYPKMVGMSPVSPVSGYRFLIGPRIDGPSVTAMMLDEIDRFCREHRLSGCHFLFVETAWQDPELARRFYPWHHGRFSWENRGYDDFEAYLATFSAGQRRNIRRERRSVADQQISVTPCAGKDAPVGYFERMYEFYLRTNAKFGPWGCRYLTEAFFDGLAKTCRRHLLFMAAHKDLVRGLIRWPCPCF